MPLKSKPIYIIKPVQEFYHGNGFVPYYYQDELEDK